MPLRMLGLPLPRNLNDQCEKGQTQDMTFETTSSYEVTDDGNGEGGAILLYGTSSWSFNSTWQNDQDDPTLRRKGGVRHKPSTIASVSEISWLGCP